MKSIVPITHPEEDVPLHLKRQPFRIDAIACKRSADVIRNYRAEVENLPWMKQTKGVQFGFKLAFVAICHQMNWDFLQTSMAEGLLPVRASDFAKRLSEIKASEIANWLRHYPKQKRVAASQRAEILRDIGRTLIEDYESSPLAVFRRARGHLNGTDGFLKQLDNFDAYRVDPMRKKTNILVQDLVREGILSFVDQENIKPAIDYHIMRLYLRTGRVAPLHDSVAAFLKGRSRPRSRLVLLLREAVGDAVELTAFYSGLSIPAVNFVEWQLGRAVCLREEPSCVAASRASSLAPDVLAIFREPCPYSEFCSAFASKDWRILEEPRFFSTFY